MIIAFPGYHHVYVCCSILPIERTSHTRFSRRFVEDASAKLLILCSPIFSSAYLDGIYKCYHLVPNIELATNLYVAFVTLYGHANSKIYFNNFETDFRLNTHFICKDC